MSKSDDDFEDRLDAAAAKADDPSDRPRTLGDASEERRPQTIRRRPGRPAKPRLDEHGNPRPQHLSVSSDLAVGNTPEAHGMRTKDLATIWNMVVQQARDAQLGPEAVAIGVKKLGLGPIPSGEQDLLPINGELVMGDDQTSPGEALVQYITHCYHLPTAKTAKLYKCNFYYRAGQRNRVAAPQAELRLGPPEEIMAEINAKAQFAQEKMMNDMARGVMPKPPGFRGVGGMVQPQMQYPYAPAPQGYPSAPPQPVAPMMFYPPPPIQGASPELEAMRREVAAMMGAMNERTRIEGLMPAAPVAPTAEQEAAKTAQVVAQVMVGMGFTPALAAKLNAPPSITPAGVQAQIVHPVQALKEAFKQMKELREMDLEMRDFFTPEEEEKPAQLPPAAETKVEVDKYALKPIPLASALFGGKVPNWAPQNEEEGLASYITKLALGNAEIALNFAEKMSNSELAKALPTIIQKLLAAGLPGVASAMQAKAQLNGAPSPQPQVVAPPAPATPAWGPPRI
jgi:hypothetical protein